MNKYMKAVETMVIVILILVVAVYAAVKYTGSRGSIGLETRTCDIEEAFDSILVDTECASVKLIPSADGRTRVELCEREKTRHDVQVVNGRLTIRMRDERAWYEHLTFDFGSPSVTVFLPAGEYAALDITDTTGSVNIPSGFSFSAAGIALSTGSIDFSAQVSGGCSLTTTTGSIRVNGMSAGMLRAVATTGKVRIQGVTCTGDIETSTSTGSTEIECVRCQNLISTGTTGSLTMTDVISTGRFSLDRSTGSVKFSACDAAEISAHTATGSVKGSLLSDKVFITKTSTGSINVPPTIRGGRCEITTSTGSINITIG